MTKIVKCSFCGEFQVTNSNKVFKCRRCFKSKDIDKKKIYFESEDQREASIMLRKIKEEKFKQEFGEDFEDFR